MPPNIMLYHAANIDLVGGPFAVIESGPGVFTTLIDHLIHADSSSASSGARMLIALRNLMIPRPNASDFPDVDIGDELRRFKVDTEKMSPVMKGLAVTNPPLLRKAHNSLARPADIRGALNAIATTILDEAKAKSMPKAATNTKHGTKPPPAKRAKTAKSTTASEPPKKGKEKERPEADDAEETVYHFIASATCPLTAKSGSSTGTSLVR
ncbi:hypothetical protein FPV67DRAFT_1675634 [Lyophyllum atratum]|nr:hypothetical protein FPV67DRAFT_1675634 [Lyophyllum atratum]